LATNVYKNFATFKQYMLQKPKKRFYLLSSCCENKRTNVDTVVIKYSSNNINDNVVVMVVVLLLITTTTTTAAAAALLLQLSFRNILTFLRNLAAPSQGRRRSCAGKKQCCVWEKRG
jgi:hypothetical protein